MGFPRPEYWSGFPFRSPGDLPDPGIEPRFPALQVDFFYRLSHQGSPISIRMDYKVRMLGLRASSAWISWEVLGKFLSISGPQFSYPQNGDNKATLS